MSQSQLPASSGGQMPVRETAGAPTGSATGSSLRPPSIGAGITPDRLFPSIKVRGRNPTPINELRQRRRVNTATQLFRPAQPPRVVTLTQPESLFPPKPEPMVSARVSSGPSGGSKPSTSALPSRPVFSKPRIMPRATQPGPSVPQTSTGLMAPKILVNQPEGIPTRTTKSAQLKTHLPVRQIISGASVASARQSSSTRQIKSTTAVITTDNKGVRKTYNTQESALLMKPLPPTRPDPPSKLKPTSSKSAHRYSLSPPSELRKQVAQSIRSASAKAPRGSKVVARGAKVTVLPSLPKIETPKGKEQVVQQIISEKRIERTRRGELISRNLTATELQDKGKAVQIEMETQQLNPDVAPPQGAVKEIVTFVSEVNVTESHTTRKDDVIHEVTKLDPNIGIDPIQVSQLVEEEKEDVQNTLRISPPDLIHSSPEKYSLKKRLQALRLNSENMAFLEQSVIYPPVTGDEAQAETTPEVMAALMNSAEKGVMPNAPPVQVFNTLFTDAKDETLINISSVSPGPLGDVVIPLNVPAVIHEEVLSKEMEQASILVHTDVSRPPENSFSEQNGNQQIGATKATSKKPRKKKVTLITDEPPPWGAEELHCLVEHVGATPNDNLEASNIGDLSVAGKLEDELVKHGIEYILAGDPIQYYSRVQLRGSQSPSWFSGYMYALPNLGDVVEVAKSPSQVLFQAWKAVQPDIFSDDSIIYN